MLARQLHEAMAGPLDEAADFIDLDKIRGNPKELVWEIIRNFRAPNANVVWVRDAKGLLQSMKFSKGTGPDGLRMALNANLDPGPYGGGSGFEMDTNDGEIYADGPGTFEDGEWGYRSTQATEAGILKALQADPPKTNVEPVRGSTGRGWKITISKPYGYYLKAGNDAAAAEQAKMRTRGMKPGRA
jgi:hypothetical protein